MKRAVAFAAILAALLAVSAGMRRTTDLSALLPSDGDLSAAAAALSTAAGTVVLEVDGTGVDRSALQAAVEAVAEAARATGRFSGVRAGVDPLLDGRAIGAVAVRHAVALLPEEVLRQRTSEAGVEAALLGWRGRMAGPASAMAARGLQDDPLDLGGLVIERLRAPAGTWDVHPESGLLLDRTGTYALVLGTTNGPSAEDPDFAAAMARIAANASLPTRWFGGPRVAGDMARTVRRDVAVTSALGIAALIGILAVGLRSARAVVGLAIPLASVVAAIGAALAVRSPIHGISLGFGGALLGLAADYWIHLHVAAARLYSGPDPALRRAAGQRAWQEIRTPLAVAAGTTSAAFSFLLFSRYPVVRDLGAAGLAAIAAAFGATALVGPLVFGWSGGRDARWSVPRVAPWAARLVIAACAALAVLATGVRWDGDPRNLIAVEPETAAIEASLTARYGGAGAGGVVLVPDLDTAAQATAALAAVPGVTVSSPTRLLPGPALEARRRAALPEPAVLRARVEAAAARVGFRPDGLLPAIERYYVQPPLTAAAWNGTPLQDVVDRAMTSDRVRLEVVLADPALAPGLARRLPPSADLVVPVSLAAAGVREIRDELAALGGAAALAILGVLIVRYRRPARVAAAAFPVVAAITCTLGTLTLLGWPLDAVGTSLLVLVLGLSVDYGIFLADGQRHATGVVLSALTSMAGFGVLVASRSAGLASAGLVVLVGLCAAAIAGVAVTPHLADGTLLGPRGWRALRGAGVAAIVVVNLQTLVLVRFVARPPQVAPGPVVALPAGAERRVANGELRRSEGIWTMALAGTPTEMGVAHGRLAADLRARLEEETHAAFERAVPNVLGRAAILEGVFVVGAGLDAHLDRRWREELAGLVAGAPDPHGRTLPAYTRKLYFHALHDIGQALVDSPLVGCTGFLATGSATTGGHTLLARNFDFEGGRAFDEDKVVIVRRPAAGLASVSVAFPGMVGVVSGMNERGIALAIQAAGSEVRMRLAEPTTLVLREALEEATSLDGVQAVLERRRGFATALVLAADGASGEAAVFEVTPDRVERLPAGALLAVSNHLRSPVFANDEENRRRMTGQTTVPRLARMTELTEARRGSLDLESASEILRDRGGLPRGHRHAIDADIASHGVIFDATAGVVWVSVAPNLSGGFVAYDLADLLAGRLEPAPVVPRSDVGEALRTHRARDLLREAERARGGDVERLLREALRHRPDHPEILLALAERVEDPAERRALVSRIALPETARDRQRLTALQGQLE